MRPSCPACSTCSTRRAPSPLSPLSLLSPQVNQKYALDHQMVVVECLEDPDETLKRKTLDLLFAMTNASNIIFVADTLLGHLRSTTDQTFRGGLVDRITQLAERSAQLPTAHCRATPHSALPSGAHHASAHHGARLSAPRPALKRASAHHGAHSSPAPLPCPPGTRPTTRGTFGP